MFCVRERVGKNSYSIYTITGPENHLINLALKKKTYVLITMKVKLPNYRPQ